VALAAAAAGAAQVIANDIDPVALHIARCNARVNDLPLACMEDDIAFEGVPPEVEVVVVADLFYERAVSQRLLSALIAARRHGVAVLVADARRPFAPSPRSEPLLVRTAPADRELEGVSRRRVRVYSL
jgi:predicted nicotinamide N-methyase